MYNSDFWIYLHIKKNTLTVAETPPQHIPDRGEPGNENIAGLELASVEDVLCDALG
jgi:hypothetical protein